MNKDIIKIYHLINDDAWASEFQSLGQYRTALLKEIRDTIDFPVVPPVPPEEDKKKDSFLL